MNSIYPLITLESLPETMGEKDVRAFVSFLMVTAVNSKDFQRLKRHQQSSVIDFCMSIQEILLSAYKKPNA